METQTIGAYDAKTHLPRLLDEVAQGQTFVITKRGVPVARLVPVEEGRERLQRKRAAVDAIRKYRRTAPPLGNLSAADMIAEGRM
jgi:prevent-host-death family protein